jgi:hypothetical protein
MGITSLSYAPLKVFINKVEVPQDELEYYTVADVEVMVYADDYN